MAKISNTSKRLITIKSLLASLTLFLVLIIPLCSGLEENWMGGISLPGESGNPASTPPSNLPQAKTQNPPTQNQPSTQPQSQSNSPSSGTASGADSSPHFKLTFESTLRISEVIAEVDGKKDTLKNSGERLKEGKEESDIKLKVVIKNVWGKEIENIKVAAAIKGIDDGDELEDDSVIDRLNSGESKNVNLDFKLPLRVDDGSYDVEIDAKGRDKEGNLHIAEWELKLKVEKDKHNVKITKALFSPSVVQCSREVKLGIGLLNLGGEEESVELKITNEQLGIGIIEKGIGLSTGTDSEAEYEKTFRMELSDSIEDGIYPIQIKAGYNKGRSAASKQALLVVEECRAQINQKQNKALVKSLSPYGKTPDEIKAKNSGGIISAENEKLLFLGLTLFLIVMLGLIIFLFWVMAG